jgi:large subunit ribosomal protein L21
MKYAVIVSGGRQLKVQEGETIAVEKLDVQPDASYTFDQVLLVVDGDKREFGKPTVAGVVVTGTVVGNKKTAKVRVAKFKAKAKYRRVTGSRKIMTHVKIDKIGSGKK